MLLHPVSRRNNSVLAIHILFDEFPQCTAALRISAAYGNKYIMPYHGKGKYIVPFKVSYQLHHNIKR